MITVLSTIANLLQDLLSELARLNRHMDSVSHMYENPKDKQRRMLEELEEYASRHRNATHARRTEA